MFEFRFVKGAIRRSAAKRRRIEGRIASQRRRGRIGRKNKTQTTAFMFVLKTAGGGRISRGYIRAKACRGKAHRRQTCHRRGRVVRGKCVGREGYWRKARYKKMCRGAILAKGASASERAYRWKTCRGGLSEEVVSEEQVRPQARLRISAVRPPVGRSCEVPRPQASLRTGTFPPAAFRSPPVSATF